MYVTECSKNAATAHGGHGRHGEHGKGFEFVFD